MSKQQNEERELQPVSISNSLANALWCGSITKRNERLPVKSPYFFRLLLLLASTISKEDKELPRVVVYLSSLFNESDSKKISQRGGKQYKIFIENLIYELRSGGFARYEGDEIHFYTYFDTRLVTFNTKEKTLEIGLNDELRSDFINLNGNFTQLELSEFNKLKSVRAQLLYMRLSSLQFLTKKKPAVTLTVDELNQLLYIPKKLYKGNSTSNNPEDWHSFKKVKQILKDEVFADITKNTHFTGAFFEEQRDDKGIVEAVVIAPDKEAYDLYNQSVAVKKELAKQKTKAPDTAKQKPLFRKI